MSDQPQDRKAPNAWVVVEPDQSRNEFPCSQFAAELDGERKLYAAVAEGDWLLLANASGAVTRVGRVLRVVLEPARGGGDQLAFRGEDAEVAAVVPDHARGKGALGSGILETPMPGLRISPGFEFARVLERRHGFTVKLVLKSMAGWRECQTEQYFSRERSMARATRSAGTSPVTT